MYNFNPYMQQPQIVYNAPQQRTEIIRVSGENGARAYQMAPNSSALLLDESNPVVWLVTTDGAGYKTATPYEIKPHTPEPAPNFSALEERIRRLEEKLNGKPNSGQIDGQ